MNSTDLTPYENDTHLIAEVSAQISKDFNTLQLEIPISESPPATFTDLHNILSASMEELAEEDPSKCAALLYRIDIPENLVATALTSDHFPDALAGIILRRELQKVIFRKTFDHQQ